MKHSTIRVHNNKRFRDIWIAVFWLIVWQILSIKIANDFFLPGPITVVQSLGQLVVEPMFYQSIGSTMIKIGFGFLMAFVTGCLLGSLAYRFQLIEELISPLISIIKCIPIASMIILILVWVHSAYLSIVISFTVVTPMIYFSVLEGLKNVDERILEMATVYQMKPLTKIRYIYLSELLPYVTSSTKTALGFCWKSGISAEIIGLPRYSIGEQLYYSKIYLNISDLFAWTLVIVALSMLFETIFFHLCNRWLNKLIS